MPSSRRGFLKMMAGGVAAAAAVRSFPFRVFSFPAEVEPFSLLDMPALPDFGPHMAGWISYRFHYTVSLPPDTNMRIRYIGLPDAHDDYLLRPDGTKIFINGPCISEENMV